MQEAHVLWAPFVVSATGLKPLSNGGFCFLNGTILTAINSPPNGPFRLWHSAERLALIAPAAGAISAEGSGLSVESLRALSD